MLLNYPRIDFYFKIRCMGHVVETPDAEYIVILSADTAPTNGH